MAKKGTLSILWPRRVPLLQEPLMIVALIIIVATLLIQQPLLV